VGMLVTKERLDILNRVNKSNLEIKIIDLYDENELAAGTRVELNIPLSR
jgi:hypothetical protein